MKSYQIGSLFGIPVKLDLTFLIVSRCSPT